MSASQESVYKPRTCKAHVCCRCLMAIEIMMRWRICLNDLLGQSFISRPVIEFVKEKMMNLINLLFVSTEYDFWVITMRKWAT